jgi:uncharacterized lipoprotein YajG
MKALFTINLFLLTSLAIFTSCKTRKKAQESAAVARPAESDTAKRVVSAVVAREDIRRNDPRYYSFGIVAPSKAFIATMQNQYHITVLSQGCVVGDGLMDYNAVIDSFVKANYGKSISEINQQSRNLK